MRKTGIGAVVALLCSTSLISAAVLTEDFETAYSPGAIVTATWGTQDSYVNPGVWAASGGNNWSQQTLNGDGVNDALFLNNCNQSYSKAGFYTISNDFGFDSATPTTYSMDLLGYSLASSDSFLILGVIEGGTTWDTATDGFIIGLAWNFVVQQKVGGVVTTFCSGNHNELVVTAMTMTLSNTGYSVDFTGMGYYNVTGAFTGTLTDAMSTGSVTVEMSNYYWGGPSNATVDNVTVVPEPLTLALLATGGLMLRRRR